MDGAPPSPRSQRMLAAIVVTDAVGFSARMSADEERALTLIHKDLQQIAELCDFFEGQVLKTTGDGTLMYFFSAIQAVACALEIQKTLGGTADVTSDGFVHRIGIHLGDVFINESDIMGTGVNIAARLEAFATPGEICVSQTVYDMVKNRLDMEATYLGPLALKNIQEPVPAYQIRPAIAPEPSESDPTLPFADQPSPEIALEQALAALTQHPDRLRLKKLLFGTCQNIWENDPAVLDQFSLRSLVSSLMQRNSSLEQCRASLYRIVATLNRKEVYSELTETILQAIAPLYKARLTPSDDHGDPVDPTGYQRVADSLDENAEAIRIKKVLYCLCHSVWENNSQTVNQIDTAVLVNQLHQLAPTPRDLKYRLRYLLKHLNRKAQYAKIVDAIFKAFHPLYQSPADSVSVSTPGLPGSQDESSPKTCFAAAPMQSHPEATVAYSSVAIAPSPKVSEAKDRSDLFELRLDIIKYGNPLRAKILLYSVLYSPFTGSQQEWSVLRSKTLEDLLREAFDYCTSYPDLESKLTIILHCLTDVAENEPVVSAILNAVRPYYPAAAPSASLEAKAASVSAPAGVARGH